MRVLIVGDVHGQHERLADILRREQAAHGIAAAIQVGDYGFDRNMAGRHPSYPVPVHVIDGNHEDHDWLQGALDAGASARWRTHLNLFYQPRPSVTRIGKTTVGFIGGALHVDRPQRHNRLAGLPNYILRRHAEEASALFNRARPALIVSHSCPSRIGIGVWGPDELMGGVIDHVISAGFDPGPREDCGEAELSRLWQALEYGPRAWVFGHHHRPHATTVDDTNFVCVGDLDASEATRVVWDTEAASLAALR